MLPEAEFFIDNPLVRIHFIIVMIRWTGLAPWEFEFPFPGGLAPTFLVVLPFPLLLLYLSQAWSRVIRVRVYPSFSFLDHMQYLKSDQPEYLLPCEAVPRRDWAHI